MLYLIPLAIVVFLVSQDRNIADYMHLKIFREFPLAVQIFFLKNWMLLRLKYDSYRIKKGHIPGKFMRMASELRKDQS